MDEAWCDVIPMIVCHMLLGCPWLYDRKVLYDGYALLLSKVRNLFWILYKFRNLRQEKKQSQFWRVTILSSLA